MKKQGYWFSFESIVEISTWSGSRTGPSRQTPKAYVTFDCSSLEPILDYRKSFRGSLGSDLSSIPDRRPPSLGFHWQNKWERNVRNRKCWLQRKSNWTDFKRDGITCVVKLRVFTWRPSTDVNDNANAYITRRNFSVGTMVSYVASYILESDLFYPFHRVGLAARDLLRNRRRAASDGPPSVLSVHFSYANYIWISFASPLCF